MAGEDYIIKIIRDVTELQVLEKELESFRQRELDGDRALYKMKLQETEKYVAREKALIKELNQSIKDGVQTNKNASVVKQQSNLTGQSTQLGSIDALKQQITHYTQLRDKVSANSPEFANLDTKVRTLTQAKKDLLTQTKLNSSSFLEFGKNLAEIKDGLVSALSGLVNFGKEAVTSAAKVQVLKENLKLTEEEFQLLKTAAAGSVTEQELLPLAAYGKQVGLTTNEIAQFISKSEQLNDEGIGDTASNFKTLTQAILTNGDGLETLGISQQQFNDDLEKTAESLGLTVEKTKGLNGETEISIKGLDAEKQALLNKMTLLNGGYVHSLEEAKNKQVDVADKLDLVKQKLEEAKVEAGSFMLNALQPLIDKFIDLDGQTITTITLIGQIGGAFIEILPHIASAKIAFAEFSLAAVGKVGAVIAITYALYEAVKYVSDKLDELTGNDYKNKLMGYERSFGGNAVYNITPEEITRINELRKQGLSYEDIYKQDLKKEEDLLGNLKNTKKEIDAQKEKLNLKRSELKTEEQLAKIKKQVEEANKKSGSKGSSSRQTQEKDSVEELTKQLRLQADLYEISYNQKGMSYELVLKELDAKIISNRTDEQELTYLLFKRSILDKITAKQREEYEIRQAIIDDGIKREEEATRKRQDLLAKLLKGLENEFNIKKSEIELLDDEYEKKKKLIQLEADRDVFNINNSDKGPVTKQKEIGLRRQLQGKELKDLEDERTKEGIDGIFSAVNGIVSTLNIGAHTFVGTIVNGLNTAVSLVSNIIGLMNSISKVSGIFSFLSGLLSFLPGGGAVSAIAGAAFGGGRAEGGEVQLGKTYLVGERGMELFVPRTNGYIYSNKELMQMASNGQNRSTANVMNNIYLNASVNSELIVTKGLKAMNQSNRYKKVA